MTQTQIAQILHCSQRVYSDYERGKLDIPTEILIKFADYHNVSVDYLLERTDDKKGNKKSKRSCFHSSFIILPRLSNLLNLIN